MYDSYYKEFANQEVNWLPMDTEERYLQNLKNNYNQLKKHGWIDKTFTYKFNSLGFRCDEFTNDPTLMALGCSSTVGIGLPVDDIWPTMLANKLNLRCANLGLGGGSPNTAFRLCVGYINKLNPKVVAYMEPGPYRLEIIDNVESNSANAENGWTYERLLVNGENSSEYRNFYKRWINSDANNTLNYLKNKLAIEYLCKQKNIKFIEVINSSNFKDPNKSLARDLAHNGKLWHVKAVEDAIKNL